MDKGYLRAIFEEIQSDSSKISDIYNIVFVDVRAWILRSCTPKVLSNDSIV
jgi:hypothetical protein